MIPYSGRLNMDLFGCCSKPKTLETDTPRASLPDPQINIPDSPTPAIGTDVPKFNADLDKVTVEPRDQLLSGNMSKSGESSWFCCGKPKESDTDLKLNRGYKSITPTLLGSIAVKIDD